MNKLIINLSLLLLILQALTYSTRAEVNMRDAAYIGQWQDDSIKKGALSMALNRYYSSRSLHLGLFGFGWCTDFERRIEFKEDKKAIYFDCRYSKPIELNVEKPTQGHQLVTIKIFNEALTFNLKGQMIQSEGTKSGPLTYTYNSRNELITVHSSKIGQIHFQYKMGLVTRVQFHEQEGERRQAITYEYDKQNLVSVKKQSHLVQKNKYNEYDNLTHVQYFSKEKSDELIVYNNTLDRVEQYANSRNCQHRFKYQKESAQKNQYIGIAEKICAGAVIGRASYRFEHQPEAERSIANSERIK